VKEFKLESPHDPECGVLTLQELIVNLQLEIAVILGDACPLLHLLLRNIIDHRSGHTAQVGRILLPYFV